VIDPGAPEPLSGGASYSGLVHLTFGGSESALGGRATPRGHSRGPGATCYDPLGIIRPSESVPKKMTSMTRRRHDDRQGRESFRTNLLDLEPFDERRGAMNKSFHLLGTITTAAVLLSACSKDAHDETTTAAPATARFEANQPPPEGTTNGGLAAKAVSPGTGSVRALRSDFFVACDGKKAGDECTINLGGREIHTQCVAMLDESNETRMSCGSQRPPASPSSGSPRTTPIESYSPCEGKKTGDECVLKVGTQEVRSHCYAMPDGASDARISCGPPPPHR
jgi:hypothetical protein